MAKTNEPSARARARAARLRLDADRREREQRIEDAATTFFTQVDKIAELTERIQAAAQEQTEAIAELLAVGEKPTRIQDLLAISSTEYAQLKPGTAPRQPAASDDEPQPGPEPEPEEAEGAATTQADEAYQPGGVY